MFCKTGGRDKLRYKVYISVIVLMCLSTIPSHSSRWVLRSWSSTPSSSSAKAGLHAALTEPPSFWSCLAPSCLWAMFVFHSPSRTWGTDLWRRLNPWSCPHLHLSQPPATGMSNPTELSRTLPNAAVEGAPGTASGRMASASEERVETGMGVEGAPMWKMEISCSGKEGQFLKVRLPAVQKLAPVSHQEAGSEDGLPPKVEKWKNQRRSHPWPCPNLPSSLMRWKSALREGRILASEG